MYPGLLVLVPAAIGLRGNIFGAFGNRISTTIHAGTFRLSARRDTILGQNILASMVLTVAASLMLALAAKGLAVATGIQDSIPAFDLATISIVGGVLGSIVVLGPHPRRHRRSRALRLGPRQRVGAVGRRARRRAHAAGALLRDVPDRHHVDARDRHRGGRRSRGGARRWLALAPRRASAHRARVDADPGDGRLRERRCGSGTRSKLPGLRQVPRAPRARARSPFDRAAPSAECSPAGSRPRCSSVLRRRPPRRTERRGATSGCSSCSPFPSMSSTESARSS